MSSESEETMPIRSEVEAALKRYDETLAQGGKTTGFVGEDAAERFAVFVAAARAWLSTPTEPTDEMIEAACHAMWGSYFSALPVAVAEEHWKDMERALRAAGRVQTEEKP